MDTIYVFNGRTFLFPLPYAEKQAQTAHRLPPITLEAIFLSIACNTALFFLTLQKIRMKNGVLPTHQH